MKNRKFYTSDLHIDHKNIIRYSNRPYSNIGEMKNKIITNWNNTVNKHDSVYILGDTCFSVKAFEDVLTQLNGIIHVMRGNHDFNAFMNANRHCKIDNVIFHTNDIMEIKDNGRQVVLCHYPLFEWNGFYRNAYHCHGHTHSSIGLSFRERAFDVGVDARNYKPVLLDELINWSSDEH